jgi:hypothetical protein
LPSVVERGIWTSAAKLPSESEVALPRPTSAAWTVGAVVLAATSAPPTEPVADGDGETVAVDVAGARLMVSAAFIAKPEPPIAMVSPGTTTVLEIAPVL